MVKSVLEYLEASEERFPSRCAYEDIQNSYTFSETGQMARAIGSRIGGLKAPGKPVAVLMEKSISMIVAFLGVLYGGCCYCPIDVTMPKERIRSVFSVLEPEAVIFEEGTKHLSGELDLRCPSFLFQDLIQTETDEELLKKIREQAVDTDAMYILFTSGSTGVPKGVVMNHRVIINNMEWLEQEFSFTEETVMGNQVPLHFDVANHDIYSPLKFGCRTVLIPAEFFSIPAKLIPFLNERRVTCIFWVPFALCVVAEFDALSIQKPKTLRHVFFAGEVMPVKQLNYWRAHIPEAVYVNMYGSTETHVCTFYRLDREFSDDETLPIGGACGNISLLVLDEENRPLKPGSEKIGELCLRGGGFAAGYYGNTVLTAERFVQNPLNTKFPEQIYRTGDMVSYNDRGELLYQNRRDFQVKRLGYRIELGEIEAAAWDIPGVQRCACLYDSKKKSILFLYSGTPLERKTLTDCLSRKLPRYMMPARCIYLEQMPLNGNGKIDRRRLMELYGQKKT